MIKRIELINFMSHERTVIEPAAGLTVLVGPNNCGKSAFVSALQVLCHNAKSNYVLRHGAKSCQVIVETDDGHTIEWGKKKNGSPHYLINGERYDRLRGGIPDKLHEILRLSKVTCDKDQFDVHFGEQKSPVFLLNDSGKASAQFFASASDAIRLVEMQDRHRAKVRAAKQDAKRLKEELADIDETLEILNPVDEIESCVAGLETTYDAIKDADVAIEQAVIMIRALSDLSSQIDLYDKELKAFRPLTTPPILEDEERLQLCVDDLKATSTAHEYSTNVANSLNQIEPPPGLEPESEFEEILTRLKLEMQSFENSDQQSRTLSNLAEPPLVQDELSLERLIRELSAADCELDEFELRSKMLGQIDSPPNIGELDELEKAVTDLKLASKDIGRLEKSLAQCITSIQTTEHEIEQWVESNPTCPTCGSPTNVGQMIPGKGHEHG